MVRALTLESDRPSSRPISVYLSLSVTHTPRTRPLVLHQHLQGDSPGLRDGDDGLWPPLGLGRFLLQSGHGAQGAHYGDGLTLS